MNNIQRQYESETGERATYRVRSADHHTLKYVRWLEEKAFQPAVDAIVENRDMTMTPEQMQQAAIDAIVENRDLILAVKFEPKAPGYPKGKLISEETGRKVYAYDPIKVLAWMKKNWLIRTLTKGGWNGFRRRKISTICGYSAA